jgi:outer membrane protein, heavy metal efflux system
MHSQFRVALFIGLLVSVSPSAIAGPVSLEQAIEKAVAAAPQMQMGEAAVAAAEASRRQAATRPNPSISVESENFIGTGSYDVFRQAELTATYSQQIERGGKRDARLALGASDVRLAQARAATARLDIAAQVQRAYIDAQIAATAVQIAQDRLRIEREVQAEALSRVRGYKDPLFVETRAAARVADAELGLREAQRRLLTARALLASYWAGDAAALELAAGPGERGASSGILANADRAVADAAIDRARSAVVVEQAKGTQDYTVSGGFRFLRGTNDVAAVAGVTIPIGRFDRNQGNTERAEAERRQTEFLAEADRLARLRRLASLGADASAALARADGIMADVYPRTVKTLEQVRWGYKRGGFRFSDVEDAANAIIAVQASWLDATTRCRDLQTEIDRLTGRFDVAQAGETNP